MDNTMGYNIHATRVCQLFGSLATGGVSVHVSVCQLSATRRLAFLHFQLTVLLKFFLGVVDSNPQKRESLV
jgi:hypothetical protein